MSVPSFTNKAEKEPIQPNYILIIALDYIHIATHMNSKQCEYCSVNSKTNTKKLLVHRIECSEVELRKLTVNI